MNVNEAIELAKEGNSLAEIAEECRVSRELPQRSHLGPPRADAAFLVLICGAILVNEVGRPLKFAQHKSGQRRCSD